MSSGIKKNAQKVEFSWTEKWETKSNGKKKNHTKEIKGWWQLRVKYKITDDTISIRPYIVIHSSPDHNKKRQGFKKSETCTITATYQAIAKKNGKKQLSDKYTFQKNQWERKKDVRSGNIKSNGTHSGFWSKFKAYKTYEIVISANINGKTSVTALVGTVKPPTPKSVVTSGKRGKKGAKYKSLVHDVNRSNLWEIWFAYEPKTNDPDYAASISKWHLYRRSGDQGNKFQEIKSKDVHHDPNGFNDNYVDNLGTSLGERYQWMVKFSNSAGYSNGKTYPENTENSTQSINGKNGARKVVTQEDKFAEWAYTPPNPVSSLNATRTDGGVTIAWDRNLADVQIGACRGYFVQYMANKDLDSYIDVNSSWKYVTYQKDDKKTGAKKGHILHIPEKWNDTDPSSKRKTWFRSLNDNQRISFRLIPYNFDKGSAPDSIYPTHPRVQMAEQSEPIGPIYFTPAKADSITATTTNNGDRKVEIIYKKASGGSVNCAKLYVKYRYTDNKTSGWLVYNHEDEEGDGVIEIERNKEKKVFVDDYPAEIYNGKTIEAIKYAVRLGVNESEYAPDPDSSDAYSDIKEMTGWVSALKRPKKPTLIFPENNKSYPVDTETVSLTWTHNPTDGTSQEEAGIDIFVFSDSVATVPSDFLNYAIVNDPSYSDSIQWKNHVDVTGAESFHNIDILNDKFYKITELDTERKEVEDWTPTRTKLSAGDRIVWRVRTRGSYDGSPPDGSTIPGGFSPFSTGLRVFKILSPPSINLFMPDVVVEESGRRLLTNLPATVTWEYSDLSGSLESLTLFISKDNEILETYDVDVSTETSHQFLYLFDNNESYIIGATASSTTTLTANAITDFVVSYVSVELKKDILIDASFDEDTGFSKILLTESSNDDTFDDAEPIIIDEEEIIATSLSIDKICEYDVDTGYLVIKAKLDKPIRGLYLAATPTELTDFYYAFPHSDGGGEESDPSEESGSTGSIPFDDHPIYPENDRYPFELSITNETDLEYTLWDGNANYGYKHMYMSFWIPPGDGYINSVYEGQAVQTNFLSIYSYSIPKVSEQTVYLYFRSNRFEAVGDYRAGKTYVSKPIDLNYEIISDSTVVSTSTMRVYSDFKSDFDVIFDWERLQGDEVYFVIPNIEDQLRNVFGSELLVDILGIPIEEDGSIKFKRPTDSSESVGYDYGFRLYTDQPTDFPITAALYDELDKEDDMTEPEILDEIPTDIFLYRIYRDEKYYIGHFTPNFTDESMTVAEITDRFCPINREFDYQLLMVTENNHIAITEMEFKFETLYWYCYWGPSYDNVAKARWNPSGSASYSRPERQEVRYSGRRYPVVYDSDAVNETYSFSVELFEDDYMMENLGDYETALETIEDYRQLMLDGGVGFWKSFEGDVYFASFDFSYTIDFKDKIKKYPCTLNVTRIEGDEVF